MVWSVRAAAVMFVIFGCKTPGSISGDRSDSGTVCVAVSVDWEGASLDEVDLHAFAQLKGALSDLPLTHFLNAAYFTRPGADAAGVRAAIQGAVRAEDEVGLHVHAWDRLVRAAGVAPRNGPSFLAEKAVLVDGEAGFDIELEAYSTDEIEAILRTSMELLDLRSPKSFRPAAWLAGARVLEGARRAGFEIDSSATDATWYEELADAPLPRRLREVWPEVNAMTQPYRISTPAGAILEMPLTGGMADYTTAAEIEAHITALVQRAVADGRSYFAQTGLHQEGAAEQVARIIEALSAVKRAHGDRVRFDTVAGCASWARPGEV